MHKNRRHKISTYLNMNYFMSPHLCFNIYINNFSISFCNLILHWNMIQLMWLQWEFHVKYFIQPFYKNSLSCLNFVYLLIELICLQPKSFLTVILLLKDNNFKDAQWVYFKQSFPILIRHWETWILCCWCWVLECELEVSTNHHKSHSARRRSLLGPSPCSILNRHLNMVT